MAALGADRCPPKAGPYSRKVVGWAIDRRIESALVLDAINKAGESRTTSLTPGIHSDHGPPISVDPLLRASRRERHRHLGRILRGLLRRHGRELQQPLLVGAQLPQGWWRGLDDVEFVTLLSID